MCNVIPMAERHPYRQQQKCHLLPATLEPSPETGAAGCQGRVTKLRLVVEGAEE